MLTRATLLLAVVLLLAGCSTGGGSASSPSSAASGSIQAGGQLGNVSVTVTRNAAARSPRDVPASTTSVRVTVLGTNIVQTVPFPSGAASVVVTLDGVPVGPQNIRIEALAGDTVVAVSTVSVTVSSGSTVGAVTTLVAVTPSPSPSPSVATSPTPSPSPATSPSSSPSGSPSPSPSSTPPDTLVFTVQPPSPVASGFVINQSVQVQAFSAGGAPDTGFTTPITLSVSPATATLSSSSLTATPVHGVATFSNLVVSGSPASYTLVATSPGASPGQSALFAVVTPHLTFVNSVANQQSVNTALMRIFAQGTSFNVEVDDVNNQPITTAGGNASMVLSSPQSPPVQFGLVSQPPSGTVTAAFSSGVATFANLAVNGVASNCSLTVSGGGLTVSSSTFSVGPITAGGAVIVGGAGSMSVGQLTRQSLDDFSFTGIQTSYAPQVMNVVIPTSGPSAGTPFLFLAGSDGFLHVHLTDLSLAEQTVSPPLNLSPGPFTVMRNQGGVLYISDAAGAVYTVDVSGFTPGGGLTFADSLISGVQGLAMDPRAAPTFWLTMAGGTSPPEFQLTTYLPNSFMVTGSYSDNHTLATLGYTDTALNGSRVVALQTSGPSTPLPDGTTSTLSAYDPTASPIPLISYGGAIRGAVQPILNDVCFYSIGTNPSVALVADAGGGTSKGVDQVELVPGAPLSAPTITAVNSCSDNIGVLAGSNPTTIDIIYSGTPATRAAAIGIVQDQSGQIYELDLTAALPTCFATFGPYQGFSGSTTATVFQPGFQLSR